MEIFLEQETEYLNFYRRPFLERGKTKIWSVHTKYMGYLGTIKWFSRWRQYCFFPEGETIYSSGCLADIEAFILDHKKDRN